MSTPTGRSTLAGPRQAAMPFAGGNKSTVAAGASVLPPEASGSPRRPEVEAPATTASTTIAIYQLDGPYPLTRWLCDTCLKRWTDKNWTAKPGGAPGAATPPTCDDCEIRRQKAIT